MGSGGSIRIGYQPRIRSSPHEDDVAHAVEFVVDVPSSSSGGIPFMTRDIPVDGDITTKAEFETALENLLGSATNNDIDPRGSWVYRDGDGVHDWEVMVIELEKNDAAE